MTKLGEMFKNVTRRRAGKVSLTVLSAAALTLPIAGCGTSGGSSNTIVVGGKNFAESEIMCDMVADLIDHDTNLKVKEKNGLDSNVTWNAMKSGDIDVYVEYTGTGLVNILKDPVTTNPQKAYNEVKQQFEQKYHITWLKPIGFNDTYAMVMQKQAAKKLGITDISQLAAKSNQLVLGSDPDFLSRSDGLPAMNKLYGTKFKQAKSMDNGLKYKALVNNDIDVTDGFSTDGQIPAYHLTVLKDDKHLFPPYYAAPIIRDSVLKAHPQLKNVLNKLAGKIDDSEMQKLNAEVQLNHKKIADVAKQWLQQNHLI